jgi:putative transcriptional regulator
MTSKEIRELRHRLGLTQEQMAFKLGVTVSCITRWENNKQSPSPLAERAIESLIDKSH